METYPTIVQTGYTSLLQKNLTGEMFSYTHIEESYFDLQQKTTPSDDEKLEMKSLSGLIEQLGVSGEGYLETAYNLLNSSVSGITWGLGVANIPVTVTSTFLSQKNRGQSFRLKRIEAPDGQVNYTFTIEIGNGNSLYALVIGDDGNSSVFIHYRNMSIAKRKQKLDELKTIEDTGRLTVEDRGNIIIWENKIKKIKFDAKSDGRTGKNLSGEENSGIETLKKQIEDLKDSKKGLNESDQERKSDLEKRVVYRAREVLTTRTY